MRSRRSAGRSWNAGLDSSSACTCACTRRETGGSMVMFLPGSVSNGPGRVMAEALIGRSMAILSRAAFRLGVGLAPRRRGVARIAAAVAAPALGWRPWRVVLGATARGLLARVVALLR